MKTQRDIEELKRQWEADSHWDIEDTPGFEDFYGELLNYRLIQEKQWQDAYNDKVQALADELQCSFTLAVYMLKLKERLEKLENKQ